MFKNNVNTPNNARNDYIPTKKIAFLLLVSATALVVLVLVTISHSRSPYPKHSYQLPNFGNPVSPILDGRHAVVDGVAPMEALEIYRHQGPVHSRINEIQEARKTVQFDEDSLALHKTELASLIRNFEDDLTSLGFTNCKFSADKLTN